MASIDDAETAKAVTDIVTSEKVTVEEFQNLVKSTDIEDLPDEAKEAIAVALTFADDEVKEEFESEVNVFEGGFDSYVPSGSTVSVETRRIIVAATAVTMAVPVASSGSGGGAEPGSTRRKK